MPHSHHHLVVFASHLRCASHLTFFSVLITTSPYTHGTTCSASQLMPTDPLLTFWNMLCPWFWSHSNALLIRRTPSTASAASYWTQTYIYISHLKAYLHVISLIRHYSLFALHWYNLATITWYHFHWIIATNPATEQKCNDKSENCIYWRFHIKKSDQLGDISLDRLFFPVVVVVVTDDDDGDDDDDEDGDDDYNDDNDDVVVAVVAAVVVMVESYQFLKDLGALRSIVIPFSMTASLEIVAPMKAT